MPLLIELPWPHVAMHPNSRLHWAKVSPVKKKYRAVAKRLTNAALREGFRVPKKDKLLVSLKFYPPNNQKRDLDGCFASCKAQLDGIADALGVDDSCFMLQLEMMNPMPPHGCVLVGVK